MITNLLKILVLTSILFACGESTQNKQNKRTTRALLVTANSVKKLSVSTQEHVSGSLVAIKLVKVFNQETGQIDKLPYYPGDNVKQGNILVTIKNDKISATLAKSKATKLQAKSDLNRLSRLIKKNLTSQDEVSQAQTALALAEAEELINQIRFNDTFIKAPFSGVIKERLYEPGDVVPLHSHILSIIDNSRLKVVVQISELLISKLLLKSKVEIKIDALNHLENITGYISRIYPTIDPITRKGTIEIELDEIPDGAKPGQLSRIIIHTPKTERLLINVSAIQYSNIGEFVYRINNNNQAIKIKVQTDLQINNKIEIIEGLREHDLIIIEGFSNLKDGSKIKIANAQPDKSKSTNEKSNTIMSGTQQ